MILIGHYLIVINSSYSNQKTILDLMKFLLHFSLF